jgi:phosphoribosylglycinamide formyltransferase 1
MSDRNLNLAFFASGNGSAVRYIHHQMTKTSLPFNISLIVTNNRDCGCAKWARAQGVPVAEFERNFSGDKIDKECLGILHNHQVDVIILGGFLRKIGPRVLEEFAGRTVNLHPALLPAFGGKGMYGRHVHEAVLTAGESCTGATIHRVDGAYDEGPIIAQKMIRIEPKDTADRLGDRVIRAEGELLHYFLDQYARGNIA